MSHTHTLALPVLLVFLLLGCDEDVTAVRETSRAFSLFGVLSPQLDTQSVHVFPIEGHLDPARPKPLDARVTSLDVQSGERWVWRDSLIQESDGMYAHVFWAPFQAAFGHTYRMEATRTDGAVSRVEVQMPEEAELVPQEPVIIGRVFLPVLVQGEVPHLLKIEVVYEVRFGSLEFNPFGVDTVAVQTSVPLPFEGVQERVDDGWLLRINLSRDHDRVREYLETEWVLARSLGIMLRDVEVHMIAANAEWDPPGGVFDLDILVQPGTLSNVENGFGFVGAGYRLQTTWVPPDGAVQAAGFRVPTIGYR